MAGFKCSLCSICMRAGQLRVGLPLYIGLQTARQPLHEPAEVPQEIISQQPTGQTRFAQPLIELRKII